MLRAYAATVALPLDLPLALVFQPLLLLTAPPQSCSAPRADVPIAFETNPNLGEHEVDE